MKKLIIIFFMLSNYFVYSDNLPLVNMELVTSFRSGKDKCELKTFMDSPVETGPTAFAFDKEGNLYISDMLNKKLVKFDSNFKCVAEFIDGYAKGAKQLFVTDNGEFIIINHKTLAMDDANGKKKFIIGLGAGLFREQTPSNPDFVYLDNKVYFRLNSGDLIEIKEPGTDNKTNLEKAKKIEPESTIELNENNGAFNKKNLNKKLKVEQLGQKKVITDGDKVLTKDFSVFKQFWKDKRVEENKQKMQKGETPVQEPDENNLSIFNPNSNNIFIGKDSDGNYYWDTNTNSIYIFNEKGILIKYFAYDMHISLTDPTVHHSGDVYFLGYDEKEVKLYKIPRTW